MFNINVIKIVRKQGITYLTPFLRNFSSSRLTTTSSFSTKSSSSTTKPATKKTSETILPTSQSNDNDSNNNIRDDNIYKDQDSTWVDKHLPTFIVPYAKLARVDRPIGTMLLLWPCWWSIGMAAPVGELPDVSLVALFGIGAFVMRGAGCTINDMWDRKYDAKVQRTIHRPLASGQITPFQALVFLGGQLSCGLGVLLQLNNYSIALGAASLGLVIIYPAMKRFTNFPQLILGLTFNWGALLGWSAVHGTCDWSIVLPLYCSGVMWTLMYDTLYAHQDKDDDKKIGLKSTALYFGNESSRAALLSFAGCSTVALGYSGYMCDMNWPFYCGVAVASSHMAWQVMTADWDCRMNLNERFVSNNHVGAIIMSGILAGGGALI